MWFDSRTFIKTEKKHNKHTLDTELTNRLVREAFKEIPQVSLVPGFISSDKVSGDVTNLGRGGSDYTAAVIAAALGADSLEIWTDVDGFMTADPRVISTAYTISELTYVEATELCNFGAKVVYPPTIYPVCHKNIPILIKTHSIRMGRNGDQAECRPYEEQGHQRYFVYQRHEPDYGARFRYGGGDRCKLPHL